MLFLLLQSLMAASNATEEQRKALREELKSQIASMRALEEEAEKEKAEQQELLTRIAAMESKVGCSLVLRVIHGVSGRPVQAHHHHAGLPCGP